MEQLRGRSRIFRRGCTSKQYNDVTERWGKPILKVNTKKKASSRGGGEGAPPHPTPRSALATNTANMKWRKAVTVSLFFPPFHLHSFNPTTPQAFCTIPSLACVKKPTEMTVSQTQWSTSMTSQKNRGLWIVYVDIVWNNILKSDNILFTLKFNVTC